MKPFVLRLSLLTATLGVAFAAHADVVLDNLVPQDDPDYTQSNTIGQAITIGARPILLTSALLPQQAFGFTSGESFAVYSRNADGTYGSALFSDFDVAFDPGTSITTATANSAFTLQTNTSYFLTLIAPAGKSEFWDYTESTDYASSEGVSIPATHTVFAIRASGPLDYFDLADGPQLIRVNGVPQAVPEPAPLAAVAAGLVAFARKRRPFAGSRAER